MQKTKFNSYKQCLCGLLFYGNVKRTHTDQSILHFFAFSPKRNNSITFKCRSSNKPFLQCVCYQYDFLQRMCFILCDNWKILFFKKVYRYSEGFADHHAAVFLEKSISKEVRILRYIHNNSTMLIPKFKNQVYYTCEISIINLNFLILFQIFLYK